VRFTLFAEEILHENHSKCSEQENTGDILPQIPVQGLPIESIGEYLKKKRYSDQFITYFLIPMMAAPWCIDPDEFARTFPAKTLIQFM
jgi:predicted NAD/FAD-binding protein